MKLHGYVLSAVALAGIGASGCERGARTQQVIRRAHVAPPAGAGASQPTAVLPAVPTPAAPVAAPVASAAAPVAPAAAVDVKDARYVSFVRPMLARLGCDNGSCHGVFKGGGLWFATGRGEFTEDYERVLERLDRSHPEQSLLYRKATALAAHNGGKNLDPLSCDAQRLLAWIGLRPDPGCQAPVANEFERFAREVAPALTKLGCAAGACHTAGPSQAKLDLGGLIGGRDRDVYASFQRTGLNRVMAWMSPVLRAALGADGIHAAKAEPRSCAYRRLHGFVGQAPENDCALDGGAGTPSLSDFTKVVMPALSLRGCTEANCHGSGRGDMALVTPDERQPAIAIHDYVMLTGRVEDRGQPDESTLLRTLRNQEPHGGGQRLGGTRDCVDRAVVSWLRGRKVAACPPPPPPPYERFAKEVQPVLDKMTCSQKACHGGTLPVFALYPHATSEEQLRHNYRQVLQKIDLNYMPLSQVQLRMKDTCAYGTVGAWIEGQPRPICTMRDPDPGLFPKVEKKLQQRGG